MTCIPERVTGYVDGELDERDRAEVEAHIAGCPACRDQAEAEREMRRRLRGLPAVDPTRGLEARVRRGLRPRPRLLRWALPLAAGLAIFVFWARGSAPMVARELVLDHAKCFRKSRLPAKVFTSDVGRVTAWFEAQGTRLPLIPETAGSLELVGARYCPLLDGSYIPHLYYTGEGDRHLSMYVLPRALRIDGSYAATHLGRSVHLTRAAGLTVGLVGERSADVEAFRRRFDTTVALANPP